MTFSELAPQVISPKLLLRREWPDILTPPSDSTGGLLGFGGSNKFWEQVRNLRSFTDRTADKFSEAHVGSTGWEYAFTTVYAGTKFYYTPPYTSRDYNEVSTAHHLKVKTETTPDGNTVTDTFILDDKVLGTRSYKGDKEIDKRNTEIREHKFALGFFAHFHSHPQQQITGHSRRVYGFFSPQDLSTFISSHIPVMGLVTDRLWLIGKTQEFADLVHGGGLFELGKDLQEVSRAELGTWDQLREAASECLSKYELAGYTAEIGKTLTRIT